MSVPTKDLGIGLTVSDVSGQKMKKVNKVPPDATIGELIQGLLAQMQLPQNDVAGRPLRYQARLDREGRHLQPSELVGEALRHGDNVMLQPNVDAGLTNWSMRIAFVEIGERKSKLELRFLC